MLHKYNCKVKPLLDSNLFGYFAGAFSRHRILDKWFYFYMNEPIKPIVIWKISSTPCWQLQPGTNRYIGTALRGNNEWIDGVLITDEVVNIDEIEILHKVDSIDWCGSNLELNNIPSNAIHQWGIGSQITDDEYWFLDAYKWITKNVKNKWGLEYQGKVFYVSPGMHHIRIIGKEFYPSFRKTKVIVKAIDYPNLQTAVKTLFEMIKLYEF